MNEREITKFIGLNAVREVQAAVFDLLPCHLLGETKKLVVSSLPCKL